ncbi:MAG: cyclic nucleotide-binding domain-containing protein [Deltaproteobacteria bacterium]|nr:cyclic nucleotide-binding domain-containing protein [Deltaproteobacteria bacterium]
MVSELFNMSTLRAIPLFAPLTPDELEQLRPAVQVVATGPGEVVVREGDSADRLYCLVEGEVQVIKNYLEPGAQTVDILSPGDFFGEMALVGEDAKRSATVITSEPSRFLTLDKEAFREVLLGHANIAYAVLVEAFRRLRQANDIIATIEDAR